MLPIVLAHDRVIRRRLRELAITVVVALPLVLIGGVADLCRSLGPRGSRAHAAAGGIILLGYHFELFYGSARNDLWGQVTAADGLGQMAKGWAGFPTGHAEDHPPAPDIWALRTLCASGRAAQDLQGDENPPKD